MREGTPRSIKDRRDRKARRGEDSPVENREVIKADPAPKGTVDQSRVEWGTILKWT